MHAIYVENLTKQYGTNMVLNGINMKIDEGEFYALMGPNGSGKTTVFNMMSGFYKPTVGTIRFQGRDVTGLRPDRITASGGKTKKKIFPPQSSLLEKILRILRGCSVVRATRQMTLLMRCCKESGFPMMQINE